MQYSEVDQVSFHQFKSYRDAKRYIGPKCQTGKNQDNKTL